MALAIRRIKISKRYSNALWHIKIITASKHDSAAFYGVHRRNHNAYVAATAPSITYLTNNHATTTHLPASTWRRIW